MLTTPNMVVMGDVVSRKIAANIGSRKSDKKKITPVSGCYFPDSEVMLENIGATPINTLSYKAALRSMPF